MLKLSRSWWLLRLFVVMIGGRGDSSVESEDLHFLGGTSQSVGLGC